MTGLSANAAAGRRALHAYSILHTTDLDEARKGVSEVFSPHELKIVRRDERFDTYMSHAPMGGISINRLRYGASVDIDVGCTSEFLLVMMPLSGVADVRCGEQSVRSTPEFASVVSPTLPLQMCSRYDADQIMVRIDRELIERYCMQHLGHDLRRPIEFELGMNLSGSAGASWRSLIRYLVAELDRGPKNVFTSPLTRVHVEQLVVSTLLLTQPNGYREELLQPARPIAPAYVKRVETFIQSCADQPLTIGDLAAHVGVSASTLFAGFREYRKTSPMALLKSVRLQRAHDELSNAEPGTISVTEAALRWGFTHLGRFASDYRRRYGELPSDTLRH
ncbi:MAG: helix-turn-helix transcriptional regulator [Burkholderiaceae bacterium]|nr:helix-turn-helix transcriptional regulator [Burkholderiaceae bacterium]